MIFAVEAWDPDYGSAMEQALVDARIDVDATIERDEASWAPIDPRRAEPHRSLCFVDGVRRIEAHVWITAPDGGTHQGICASYGAGVVRCDGRAVVEQTLVRRSLFCHPDGAEPIETRHGQFALHAVPDADPAALSNALQRDMGRLEVEAAALVGAPDAGASDGGASDGGASDGGAPGHVGPVVVDGPLKEGQVRAGFVGFVKTHHTRYGPPWVAATVGTLAAGERTPLLCFGGPRPRYSWYLRLPGPGGHAWAGVVRLEVAAACPLDEAVELADRASVTLPAFASTPHKDTRAPQNLFPIAGLERDLRRRLGDPQLLVRALRAAAAGRHPLD